MEGKYALYGFVLLFLALILRFVYMFVDTFGGDGTPAPKSAYVNVVPGEGPSDSAARWLKYHR